MSASPQGRARSSAVEHSLHTRRVTGSIPVAPTTFFLFLCPQAPGGPHPRALGVCCALRRRAARIRGPWLRAVRCCAGSSGRVGRGRAVRSRSEAWPRSGFSCPSGAGRPASAGLGCLLCPQAPGGPHPRALAARHALLRWRRRASWARSRCALADRGWPRSGFSCHSRDGLWRRSWPDAPGLVGGAVGALDGVSATSRHSAAGAATNRRAVAARRSPLRH